MKVQRRIIKRVLLINPPNTMPADSVRRIGEPLGLLYLGATLVKAGFKVSVFDMACEGYHHTRIRNGYVTYGSLPRELRKKILEFRPDIVGVNCMFTAREKNTMSVCKTIKEVSKRILVVLGGLHPGLFPERFLKTGWVDYIILGEGEFRIVKLLKCLNQNEEPNFDGVAFLKKGKCQTRIAISRIDNLDLIPYPDRDLVDIERYIRIGVPFAPFSYKQRVAQILATRGCPNKCNFCSSVVFWGRQVRTRSVDNIIGEMRLLKDRYNIEEIQFVDDNLTVNKGFAMELFRRMKQFSFKWCTPNGLMFNTIDPKMIKLMAESGAYQLSLAIESGSKRVLKEIIHKNVDLDRVKGIIEEAHKYDISIHSMFVVGFPGETKEEIMQTLEFPFKVGPDSASFFIVNPLPGSELHELCEKKNYLAENYSAMDFKSVNIKIPKNSPDYYGMEPEELVKLVDEKTHEFNEWVKKRYPERWQKKFDRYLVNHPEERKKIMGRVT